MIIASHHAKRVTVFAPSRTYRILAVTMTIMPNAHTGWGAHNEQYHLAGIAHFNLIWELQA
jgi:hypothetical protein